VVLAVASASSFNGYDKSPSREGVEPSSRTQPVLQHLEGKSFEQIRVAHVRDYQQLFNRVSLQLGEPGARADLPTDERRIDYVGKADPSFMALDFSLVDTFSSPVRGRVRSPPSAGPLERRPYPALGGHLYDERQSRDELLGAELVNLTECNEPLFQFMRETAVTGRQVATRMYHRPGWVMHHATTLWRDAGPVDWFGFISLWPMASGWLCEHLWEHYEFTHDGSF